VGGAFNNHQEVCVAVRYREGANQVDVDVGSNWICLLTLARWQCKHSLVQVVMSFANEGHTNLEEIKWREALIPGWAPP
jgi:hypothetical protein